MPACNWVIWKSSMRRVLRRLLLGKSAGNLWSIGKGTFASQPPILRIPISSRKSDNLRKFLGRIFPSRIKDISEWKKRFCSYLKSWRRARYRSGAEPGPEWLFWELIRVTDEYFYKSSSRNWGKIVVRKVMVRASLRTFFWTIQRNWWNKKGPAHHNELCRNSDGSTHLEPISEGFSEVDT